MLVCSASLLFIVVCVSDGTHEALGIDPPRGKFLEMGLNKKNHPRVYIPHFLQKSAQQTFAVYERFKASRPEI